jgi:zinc/manganese transport system substrate-binding protein
MRHRTLIALTAVAGATALGLTGCASSSGSASSSSSSGSGTIDVVASTNVYGGIVTSIPSQDPHSFEASSRTQLAVSKADVLIENGGGYDDYMDTLRDSTHSKADMINVVKLSGLKKAGDDDFNEHVFYSYPTMVTFVDHITKELGRQDRADAATFTANATKLTQQLTKLESETAALKQKHQGERVAYTEPVPGYLFDAVGLDNVTPHAFSEAIEEGDDVPPASLNATLQLFAGAKPVRLLAYNDQTSSPETEQVKKAASQHHVPVVGVTETLPAGKGYIAWQQSTIDAISAALDK